jgi:hypothetical protein
MSKTSRLSAAMADKRNRLRCRKGGRYDPDLIRSRVDHLRAKLEVSPKEIGGAVWPGMTGDNAARAWYKRTSQRAQDFTLPELDRAIDYLAVKAGRALPGFPFIDEADSERLERGELHSPRK